MRSIYDPILVPQGWPLVPPLRGVDAWWDERYLPDLPPSGPAPLAAGTFKVDGSSTATFVLPAYGGTDGIVVIKAARSSNGSTLTSISDNSGSGNTYTERTPAGGEVANASSRHNVWTVPFTSAMGGATVTVVYSGSNNTAGAYQVWPGYAYDNFVTNGGGGSGSTETTPALTSVTATPIAIGMGGGRGNADGTQVTLNTGSLPSGWESAVTTTSTQGATNRNAHAWMAYDGDPGSTSIASAAFPLTGSVNSRWTATMTLAPVGGGGNGSGPVSPAETTESAQALTRAKARTTGVAAAVDAAQALSRGKRRTEGIPLETDTAVTATRAKARTGGINVEPDTAQPIARTKRKTIGTALDTSTSGLTVRSKTRQVGVAGEADTAVARAGAVAVGQGLETDAAQPITRRKARTITVSTTNDAGQVINRNKRRAPGVVTESDLLAANTKFKLKALGLASAVDGAVAIARQKRLVVGQATSVGTALSILAGTGLPPNRLTAGTGVVLASSVNAGGTITLKLPDYNVDDGVVVIRSTRSSNANTATISDSTSGVWTQQQQWIDNSSDNNYVWTMPWTAARSGATVTITWTGTNQGSAVAEVWERVLLDSVQAPTGSGSGTTLTCAAATATGPNVVVIDMGGGRGNADGTTNGLSIPSGVAAGYSNAQSTNSTNTGTARNTYAWSASKYQTGNPNVAAATYTLTGTVNSRGSIRVLLKAYTAGGGSTLPIGTAIEVDTCQGITIAGGGGGGGVPGLRYGRPDTTGWTVRNIPIGGGTISLTNGVDYILQSPRKADGTLDYIRGALSIRRGRNVSWIGAIHGGGPGLDVRATAPDLNTDYDDTNRGIRFGGWTAGDSGDEYRLIYLEGHWFRPSHYLSDCLQIANRDTQGMSVVVQNFRVDAYTWGDIDTPSFHSDQFQCVGGPLNLKVHGWVGLRATYQGFYWDPGDSRPVPTGTGKEPWAMSNVYIKADSSTGGAKYMFADREGRTSSNWTGLTAENCYFQGGLNIFDSFGSAPLTGVFTTAAPIDFVPVSMWQGDVYNPGQLTGPTTANPSSSGNTAVPINRLKRKGIGIATDVASAMPVTRGRRRNIGVAVEAETAIASPRRLGLYRVIGAAVEADMARLVTVVRIAVALRISDESLPEPFGQIQVFGPAPRGPLQRIAPIPTQRFVMLWQPSTEYPDGRVIVTSYPPDVAGWVPDDLITDPTNWTTMSDTWQAQVLAANGYLMEAAT